MGIKRVTEIGSSKNKLESETLPKLSEFENDLIYKRTPFLKLTKDDFEVIESKPVAPSSITEPEVTSMEVNNNKSYFYELTPKLDWINDGNDFEKLGYNLKIKGADGEDISNEIQYPLCGNMEGNIIISDCSLPALSFMNNGKYDYRSSQYIEKNCFYIEVMDIPDTVIDFELELFKIDTPPTLPSHDDLAYYLAIGKDGKLYKYLEER